MGLIARYREGYKRGRAIEPKLPRGWIKSRSGGYSANVADFEQAAFDRPPHGTGRIRGIIRSTDVVRWERLQRDLAWVRRELERRGLNPEDFRWII